MLISTKIATELGGASPAASQRIRLADGSVVTSALGFTDATLTVGSKHHCLCETTPLISVFPLQSYDMILGKAWLDTHGALIDCPSNTITLRGTNSALVVHGRAACNIDLACTTEALHDNLGLLTCNQFQRFLHKHNVEIVAAFLVADDTPESLAHVTLVNDLAEAQQLHATTGSLDALRQKFETDTHVSADAREKFLTMLSEYHDSVFAEREFTSVDAALSREVQHEIHELPDSAPPCGVIYRL